MIVSLKTGRQDMSFVITPVLFIIVNGSFNVNLLVVLQKASVKHIDEFILFGSFVRIHKGR
jgi:hypothetical protein